jgi:hypothetical protein
MPASSAPLVCEIRAPDSATGSDLAHIAETCARETGVAIVTRVLPIAGRQQTLTLRLPAELAATQHPVWCLACRLACFCPAARVSVLILGEEAFVPPSANHDRQQTA